MSRYHTGAFSICDQLMRIGKEIDPDSDNGGTLALAALDSLGIYEDRIYDLYTYVCGSHLGKMVAVLRARELGGLAGVNTEAINNAIDNRCANFDINAAVEAVRSRLPNFNPESADVYPNN